MGRALEDDMAENVGIRGGSCPSGRMANRETDVHMACMHHEQTLIVVRGTKDLIWWGEAVGATRPYKCGQACQQMLHDATDATDATIHLYHVVACTIYGGNVR
jgi:hypothetical protein